MYSTSEERQNDFLPKLYRLLSHLICRYFSCFLIAFFFLSDMIRTYLIFYHPIWILQYVLYHPIWLSFTLFYFCRTWYGSIKQLCKPLRGTYVRYCICTQIRVSLILNIIHYFIYLYLNFLYSDNLYYHLFISSNNFLNLFPSLSFSSLFFLLVRSIYGAPMGR